MDDILQASFATRDQERRARIIKALEQSPLPGDKEHCQKLQHLPKAEDIKQLFQKLKAVRKNEVRQGDIIRIEIPMYPDHDQDVYRMASNRCTN